MRQAVAKKIRKEIRNAASDAHWEMWLAVCEAGWRRRLIMAARLVCGRPRGVVRRDQSERRKVGAG